MNVGNATSNQDAIDRVRKRLQDDVGVLLKLCSDNNFFPFWLLSRSMFPIAESIAALLYGNGTGNTSATLATFLRDDLAAIEPRYKDVASTVCQVWRHGLTHHDEPPFLIVRPKSVSPLQFDADTRAVSWRLVFNDPVNHLTFQTLAVQNLFLTFSLATFADHLDQVLADQARWSVFSGTEVMDRYNEWSVKIVDENRPATEAGRAANEILHLVP